MLTCEGQVQGRDDSEAPRRRRLSEAPRKWRRRAACSAPKEDDCDRAVDRAREQEGRSAHAPRRCGSGGVAPLLCPRQHGGAPREVRHRASEGPAQLDEGRVAAGRGPHRQAAVR